MSKTIDVIIPMYNAKNHVSNIIQCLNNQTMKDFRAIFVDDGSKDNTFIVLCDQLKQVSFENTILKQENRGAAAARNYGLSVSNAEWTVFVDCDDIILPQYLEYLYKAVTVMNADLGICRFKMVPASTVLDEYHVEKLDAREISAAECMKIHYTEWIAPVCLIINRELREKHGLKFDDKCIYCEDIPFITRVIEKSQRVADIRNILYLYRVNQGSLSRSPKYHKFISGIECFQRMQRELDTRETEAADVFRNMGCVRYYIATLRKAAVQMPYDEFLKIVDEIRFSSYKSYLCNIPIKQRVAGYLMLTSKKLFYHAVNFMFND